MAKSSRSTKIGSAAPLVAKGPSLEQLRVELRAQALGSDQQRNLVWAQTLVAEAVRAYWQTLSPTLALKEPPPSVCINIPESLRIAAGRLGVSAANEPVAEAAYH